jgi:hypothetical protein
VNRICTEDNDIWPASFKSGETPASPKEAVMISRAKIEKIK